jgi:hypothetical protein
MKAAITTDPEQRLVVTFFIEPGRCVFHRTVSLARIPNPQYCTGK